MAGKRTTNLIRNPAAEFKLLVKTRKRNSELKIIQIDVNRDNAAAALMLKVAKLKPGAAIPSALRRFTAVLEGAAIAIPPFDVPINVQPNLRLAQALSKFAPASDREVAQELSQSKDLKISPYVYLQRDRRRPSGFATLPPENNFPKGPNLIWVHQPQTQHWEAFQSSKKMMDIVASLQTHAGGVRKLDPKLRELFVLGNILTTQRNLKLQSDNWKTKISNATRAMKTDQYAVIKNYLSPLSVAVLRKYARDLEAAGAMPRDEGQVRDRYFLHNDPVYSFVHRQAGALIRRVTGEMVYPSYSFLSVYLQGAELKRHVDRPQCRWNASLLIDSIPEVSLSESWPIFLEVDGDQREVRMDLGDLVIYPGDTVPHWRPPLKTGHRQTLVLLHYVPLEYTGGLS